MFKKKFHWYSVRLITYIPFGNVTHEEVVPIPVRKQKYCLDNLFMNDAARRCVGVDLDRTTRVEVLGYLGRFNA